ncbi:MAG: DUF1549 domain-containing protein, partial [Aureliella sp.]
MRMIVSAALLASLAALAAFTPCRSGEPEHSFAVSPGRVELDGLFDRVQLVISRTTTAGTVDPYCDDLTGEAIYSCSPPDLVRIDANGQVTATAGGEGELRVAVGGLQRTIPVQVRGCDAEQQVDFLKDVRPVLSKAGCAAGACHAAQHGKGGFKLSVFGYDPDADYEQIALGARGRRISPARPDASLLLTKPTMAVPHGGGLRLEQGSLEAQLIGRWIASGSPKSTEATYDVQRLEVFPQKRVARVGSPQQLRVVAQYADGTLRDVTAMAIYDAIDTGVVNVTRGGLATTYGEGQSAIMIRYEGQVATSTFVVPFSDHADLAQWKTSDNTVDRLAADKFADLGLQPSPMCDDATFVRRAFLDAIGSLPEPEVVTEFIESSDPNKRAQLIDRLLGLTGDPSLDIYNDRYSAFWTLRWSDLIRNNSNSLGEQGMWAMHNWIRDAFRQNKPFDDFVKELVTAKGSIYSNGPANFFRVHGDSSALTEATSQLFMGLRLECAKCHQHPFESISQSDYYSMAAFFSRVGSKNSEEFGLFGRETIVMVKPSGEVSHPRTGKRLAPRPIGGEP